MELGRQMKIFLDRKCVSTPNGLSFITKDSLFQELSVEMPAQLKGYRKESERPQPTRLLMTDGVDGIQGLPRRYLLSFLFFLFFLKFLLLFNYSCMPFLSIPPPHPSWIHLPRHFHQHPWFCPCVLYSSSCNPLFPLSPPPPGYH